MEKKLIEEYKAYEALYDRKKGKMIAKGRAYYKRKFTRNEYELQYILAGKEIESDNSSKINYWLVNEYAYETSLKEANNIKRAMETINKFNRGNGSPKKWKRTEDFNFTLDEIREMSDYDKHQIDEDKKKLSRFYEVIRSYHEYLVGEGNTTYKANGIIARIFFGSV